jgi:hypothetical protein
MCSLRGEQVCTEGDDLCQVIKNLVGATTVALSQLSGQRVNATRMLGRGVTLCVCDIHTYIHTHIYIYIHIYI